MATDAPPKSEWLRATIDTPKVGVDREKNILRGFVVAQLGEFKDGRGEFDREALRSIVRMMKAEPAGLKSRFGHPTLSDDGLGKFLGRAKNARLVSVQRGDEEIPAVRADLHLSPTAMQEPVGGGRPLGQYVLELAESDPDAFSSSLVLEVNEEFRLDSKGRRKTDDEGRELPPLWRPTRLHATDIVDTGAAVDGILGAQLAADGLPDAAVREGCKLLDRAFAGKSREFIEARAQAWLQRYLSLRFDEETPPEPPAEDELLLWEHQAALDGATS